VDAIRDVEPLQRVLVFDLDVAAKQGSLRPKHLPHVRVGGRELHADREAFDRQRRLDDGDPEDVARGVVQTEGRAIEGDNATDGVSDGAE